MLITRLKVNESVMVANTKVTNIGGAPVVLGIEGTDKVKYGNMKMEERFTPIPVPPPKKGAHQ